MNYFIDFDHTLFDTSSFSKDMLATLSRFIEKNCSQNYDKVLSLLSDKFRRGNNNIYDIYDLIKYFSTKFNFNENDAIDTVNSVIFNCEKYLYNDSINFLEYLKSKGHKIYILSYNENEVYFQTVKIAGSKLLKFVNGLITTVSLKSDIPFDFSNCIFIDDKPKDLISIYAKNPLKIYRIRRPNDSYSSIETNLPIPEFTSLNELQKIL